MNEKKPVWKVYKENFNQKCIEECNIFDHNEFWDMCQIIWFNVHDHSSDFNTQREEFKTRIGYELQYYFWSKSQWEIKLTTIFTDATDFKNMKVDAYSQIMMNYDRFIEYLWNWLIAKEEN